MAKETASTFYGDRWQRDVHVSADEKTRRLSTDLPGGYWRLDVVDHVLLCNVYFPPDEFFERLSQALRRLVPAYPTPHWQLSKVLGQMIGQDPAGIVMGSGVSELIIALIDRLALRVAVPTPSFNEYERAALPDRLARYPLQAPVFDLDVDDYAAFVLKHPDTAAVVINPNNPSARAVAKPDLLRLAGVLREQGRRLIVDESFIEFTDGGRSESMEDVLDEYQNVVVLKSLGKIYGIAGLRLGYMLSADHDLIAEVRNQLPVWNVGTLAEYFMHEFHNYEQQFLDSCVQVRADCDELYRRLSEIPGMQVAKPQANFMFCHIPDSWPDGSVLVDRMLTRHKTLIRHTGGKTMEDGSRYLRIASRTPAENALLVQRLCDIVDNP